MPYLPTSILQSIALFLPLRDITLNAMGFNREWRHALSKLNARMFENANRPIRLFLTRTQLMHLLDAPIARTWISSIRVRENDRFYHLGDDDLSTFHRLTDVKSVGEADDAEKMRATLILSEHRAKLEQNQRKDAEPLMYHDPHALDEADLGIIADRMPQLKELDVKLAAYFGNSTSVYDVVYRFPASLENLRIAPLVTQSPSGVDDTVRIIHSVAGMPLTSLNITHRRQSQSKDYGKLVFECAPMTSNVPSLQPLVDGCIAATLKHLIINLNRPEDSALTSEHIAWVRQLKHLVEVSLDQYEWWTNGAKLLGELLAEPVPINLTNIHLRRTALDAHVSALLPRLPNLRVFNPEQILDDADLSILTHWPQLERCGIYWDGNDTDKLVAALRPCTQLRMLNVSAKRYLSPRQYIQFLWPMAQLEELDMRHVGRWKVDTLLSVISPLASHLKKLQVVGIESQGRYLSWVSEVDRARIAHTFPHLVRCELNHDVLFDDPQSKAAFTKIIPTVSEFEGLDEDEDI